MTFTKLGLLSAALAIALATPGRTTSGQSSAPAIPGTSAQLQNTSATRHRPLTELDNPSIKFDLQSLMDTLRDNRHEGWVLAAYPDPNTHRPLIGAGFSLDVAATDHPQQDIFNPVPFLEPSSAQLWQAAGLEPARLQSILGQFDQREQTWSAKTWHRKIRTHKLPPDLTEEEATQLLRISALQAVHNARAYCRNFDQLTASQQMAFSQLVFQMGVNLEEFVQFLSAMNGDTGFLDLLKPAGGPETPADHWQLVQSTLVQSQWARRYSTRASTVIAMFDPEYAQHPGATEQQLNAMLRPAVVRTRSKPHVPSLHAASATTHNSKAHVKNVSASKHKRG